MRFATQTIGSPAIRRLKSGAVAGATSAVLAALTSAGPVMGQGDLFTPGRTFTENERYVGTTVFHWFTSYGGQVSGPWRPLEGRENWTGEPDFWERQVKDMMDSLIDVIHVIVIPSMEQQRINLFIALSNLRSQGYDVPKVVPFLDTIITWTIYQPIDLALPSGKNQYVDQYIRFFNQYFSGNTDPFAENYLLHINKGGADRIALNVWHTFEDYTANVESLTRADVESRLAAEFGGTYPTFNNGIYQFCTPSSPSPTFCDEDLHQFSFMDYLVTTEHSGRKTASLNPGYWDQNVRTPGTFLARDGGVHYIDAWECLHDIKEGGFHVSCPGFDVDDWFAPAIYHLHIISWNEYDEGSGLYSSDPGPPYIKPPNPSTDVFSTTDNPREYIDTTAAGAAEFNPLPDRDAKILWHDFPSTMYPGQTLDAGVVVRNEGNAEWTGAGDYKLGQNELLDPVSFGPGRYPIDDNEDEIPIYGGIFRGRPKCFALQLTAPETPGTYTVHFQMVQEQVAWFGQILELEIEVPPSALNPQPPDGAGGVDPAAALSWTAGQGATGHQVYLGTDPDAVANADPGSDEYSGSLPLGSETFDPPGLLAQGISHYWRIDELQPSGPAVKGAVWTFATLLIPGDLDQDCDVDQADFGLFQACLSGSGHTPDPGCERADFDGETDVDQADLAIFMDCMNGPNRPPACEY